MMWYKVQDNNFGVVVCPFNGAGVMPSPFGLDIDLGETFTLTAENKEGWILGRTKNTKEDFLIPSNHVFRKSFYDPASEITSVVREWGDLWKKFYRDGHEYQEQVIRSGILELIEGRQQLLNGSLTKEQYEDVQLKLTKKIDWGNRKLGLDLVPRDGYRVIDCGDSMGIVQLFRYHVSSVENAEAARTTLRKRKPNTPPQDLTGGHHLMMTVRDFVCTIAEDFEIYFSVYDSARNSFVSERYETTLPASNSVFIDRIQTISTLFANFCGTDLMSDLYLVTHVLRVGRMFCNDSSAKKSSKNYRRPFAGGILSLKNSILNPDINKNQENDYTFRLHNCDEKDFWQIHDLVIKGSSKLTATNVIITVSLRTFAGDIKTVKEENPVLFKNITTSDKIGFPEVIMPGEVRNDLFVGILQGEFEKSGKTMAGKNIAVTALAVDSSGNTLESGVWSAVNMCCYESIILYHNNNPKWHETIKVQIPIEKFPDVHLRLEFRHCSTKEKNERKLFGFSFLKLMDSDGAVVKDAIHTLNICKCEESKLHPSNYLTEVGTQKSTKESVTISTQLVSTKLTQNADIVSLLKWKAQPEKVKETLVNILKLSGEEIVKFLQDVLDVLFAMFINEDGCSTEYSEDAFIVLIHIFSLLEDSKFEHFKPVMEAYVVDHFSGALVYKGITSMLTHYASLAHLLDKDRLTKLKNSFKTAEYIFKFAVQSRTLFSRATGGQQADSFRVDIKEMFEKFGALLALETTSGEELVFTQSSLLMNLKHIYKSLLKILPLDFVGDLVVQLFRSIPLFQSAHPLSPSKLHALGDLVNSDLFELEDCRSFILPEICSHIKHHLSIRDELKLTSDVLLAVLNSLYNAPEKIHHDVEIVATTVLEPLVNAVLILERSSSVITPLVVSLIALYQQMTEFNYNRFFDEFKDLTQIRSFILRSFYVFRDLIKFDVFNEDWFKMKILVNSNILKSLRSYSHVLTSYFLKPNYDSDLFLEYFNVCFSFMLQDSLQLETFREMKRGWVLKEYSDMRLIMAKEVVHSWTFLEDKIDFVPSLVCQIMQVSLLPVKQLTSTVLPLIIDLIDAQFYSCGNFRIVEAEIIDRLDTYVMDGKGDQSYTNLFHTILSAQIERAQPPWREAGLTFVGSVKSQLEILLDFRAIPNDVDNTDKKMNCINNLLIFYQKVNMRQMYIKYIYKLHDLQLASGNYSEAGFTLMLHAGMLDFKSEYETKEQLHLQVIKYFDQGKLWERGIPLCKELANIYEGKFEYTKLSNILVTTSTYFNNVLSQHRPVPEYFRVSFIGLGFPLFVRNKEFIYRGLEYERLTSFVQRIISEWPEAEVLKSVGGENNDLANSESQHLWIRSVKPLPTYPPGYQTAPAKIKSYYSWNNVRRFQYDHSLSKNLEDVSSIWIERTILEIETSFPGMLRFIMVKSKSTTVLTPIKFAVETVKEINQNLEEILSTFQDAGDGAINVNPLSMRLQGILDANVQGGPTKYQDAFFCPEFLTNTPDAADDVANLRREIQNQMDVLERALAVHGTVIPLGVQPLHNRLVECFNAMVTSFPRVNCPPVLKRSESLRICSSIVNTPLPPLPKNDSVEVRDRPHQTSLVFDRQVSICEDENLYSIPTDNPPPIPGRKKKLLCMEQSSEKTCPTQNNNGKSNNDSSDSNSAISQNDYIIMPPSQLRESYLTPPRPPKHDSNNVNGSKTPPPVPPKPSPNRDSSGRSSDRRSNSSAGSSNYKEYYVLPVKK